MTADLKLTAQKIDQLLTLMAEQLDELSEEELAEFESYLGDQEAMGPMLHPTRWRDDDLFTATDLAKERVLIIRTAKAAIQAHELKKTAWSVSRARAFPL